MTKTPIAAISQNHPNSTRRRIMRLRHALEVAIKSMHDCKDHAHHHAAKAEAIKQLHKDRLIAAKNKMANEEKV